MAGVHTDVPAQRGTLTAGAPQPAAQACLEEHGQLVRVHRLLHRPAGLLCSLSRSQLSHSCLDGRLCSLCFLLRACVIIGLPGCDLCLLCVRPAKAYTWLTLVAWSSALHGCWQTVHIKPHCHTGVSACCRLQAVGMMGVGDGGHTVMHQ